jgi:hypothetical protein
VNIRYFAGSMELTDQAIKQARGNEGAFVNLLENDRKLLAQDMKKNVNRQVFGAGNGVITTLTSSSPAAGTTRPSRARSTSASTTSSTSCRSRRARSARRR